MATLAETLDLAMSRHRAGDLAGAEQLYRQVLEVAPGNVDALHLLGLVAHQSGRNDLAIQCIRRALDLRPDFLAAHTNLGKILLTQGRFAEAVASYQRALDLRPDYADAHKDMAIVLKEQGRLEEAEASCHRALRLRPDFAEAHNSLGIVLAVQGQMEGAAACFQRAVHLLPDYAEAHANLGNTLAAQGKLEEAAGSYQRCLRLQPGHLTALAQLIFLSQQRCVWGDLKELSGRAIAAVECDDAARSPHPLSPFVFLALPAPPSTAAQQCRCARALAARYAQPADRSGQQLAPAGPRDARSRITVGYLSADFHTHATAHLIVELFERHDRSRFDVIGYSYGPDDGSPMRRRLVQACDRFVDVKGDSFAGAARRIAADRVDILVDLKGYTLGSRAPILALRPAPVQVNYLGYPGTMGASFIDYILADEFIVPTDQWSHFTEKVVYLPGCYQVNDSQRAFGPRIPSRAECGLPAEGFVFCCFNHCYKITPEIFSVWMELLRAVPASVLWLLESNPIAPTHLRREAERQGVTAGRLVFARHLPPPEHLARYRLAQVFLDTFPVNAHTTASDALWAGCPVLTLAGDTLVSRVAGSLLRVLGLSELVTTSLSEYRDLALRLAQDANLLGEMRARLEGNRQSSALFNAGRFARNVEQAYDTMWEIHHSGAAPRAFTVISDRVEEPPV
jgi:predicted O-linked N-acetylglucosamine transferase (SPINDLY family)